MKERCVLIPKSILANLAVLRARKLPFETGGFLIGKRRDLHIEITDITAEGWGDVATPFSFLRSDINHASRIENAWLESNKIVGLVGDWHTHPEGDGSPSGTDRRAWRILVGSMRADGVGVILGEEGKARVFAVRRRWPSVRIAEYSIFADEPADMVFSLD